MENIMFRATIAATKDGKGSIGFPEFSKDGGNTWQSIGQTERFKRPNHARYAEVRARTMIVNYAFGHWKLDVSSSDIVIK